MHLSNAIRQRIINLTIKNNMNLKELSVKSKLSYSTLMGFMGKSNKTITLAKLYKICLGLDIDLVDFFDDALFKDTFDENEKNVVKNS